MLNGKTVAVVSNNNSATHNVVEKLEKKNAAFLTAFLGSVANRQAFLDSQTGAYPNMKSWELQAEACCALEEEVKVLSKELNDMLNNKNRIAEIEQELLRLVPEQHYFEEYYDTYGEIPAWNWGRLSSKKIFALWMELERHFESKSTFGLFQRLFPTMLLTQRWKSLRRNLSDCSGQSLLRGITGRMAEYAMRWGTSVGILKILLASIPLYLALHIRSRVR